MPRSVPAIVFWCVLVLAPGAFATLDGSSYLRVLKLNMKIVVLELLGDMRRHEDQLVYAEEQVRLARQLFKEDSYLVRISYENLFVIYNKLDLFEKALALSQERLELCRAVFGGNHAITADVMGHVASAHSKLGQTSEAVSILLAAISILERADGDSSKRSELIASLTSELYRQGRTEEANLLLGRARENTAAARSSQSASSDSNNSARAWIADAEAQVRGFERRFGRNHPELGVHLRSAAIAHLVLKQYDEAEAHAARGLAIAETTFGTGHLSVANMLDILALIKAQRMDTASALPFHERALKIKRAALPEHHPEVVMAHAKLAQAHAGLEHWRQAYAHSQLAEKLMAAQLGPGKGLTTFAKSSWEHRALVQGLDSAAALIGQKDGLIDEAFGTAQWALQTSTSAALSQMAARARAGSERLADLMRERQSLVERQARANATLLKTTGLPTNQRSKDETARLHRELEEIGKSIAGIDRSLASEFSEFTSLAYPRPLSIAQAREQLATNEALVQFLLTSTQGLVWIVDGGGGEARSRLLKLPLGAPEIAEHVTALRAGLDRRAASARSEDRAAVALGEGGRSRDFPPFDLAVAHELYEALFGQAADLIKDKHLLIVPSGPLTSLPFHALVTAKPDKAVPDRIEDYARAAWLAKANAITVLPSVASLAALRRLPKESRAPDPYIGFGNPLLVGASGTDQRASLQQSCPNAARPIELAELSTEDAKRRVSEFFRGGAADVVAVRRLAPLPETAHELCEVGSRLGGGEGAIVLGEAATESTIKRMSADGRLGRARVVHFATHGLVAGEIDGLAEPALVLTPPADHTPATQLEQDDGLLTASEVAQLKLNADWVVLSACNTASGDSGNAEALSGLARAFFYAGARALLVSHWRVNSEAAVKLTTRTFTMLEQQPAIGRAEALRHAMLATIAEGGRQAHPAYWAPFVVVGEGGGQPQAGLQVQEAKPSSPPSAVAPASLQSSAQPVQPSAEAAQASAKPAASVRPQARPGKKAKAPARDWRSEIWRQNP